MGAELLRAFVSRGWGCVANGLSQSAESPTTSSSAKSWPARTPRRCPRVRGVWRDADHSLSLRASWPLCWSRSSRRAAPSAWYAAPWSSTCGQRSLAVGRDGPSGTPVQALRDHGL